VCFLSRAVLAIIIDNVPESKCDSEAGHADQPEPDIIPVSTNASEGGRMPGQSAARSTLQDRVYGELSADITHGVLRPGERLRVAHLAKRFGTSQAPVREALRRLTEEGRAVTVPYVGSVVKEPSWAEIQDIYALRTELEAFAIRRILTQKPPVSLVSVRRALRDLARAVRTGDEVQVIDADLRFHRSILALAGSELTLEMWDTIIQRFRGARLTLLRQHPDDFITLLPSHEVLIEALERGDTEQAQAHFREHLTSAAREWAARTGHQPTGATPSDRK
jgi:DNA-binding GntR family transcriptional regulator